MPIYRVRQYSGNRGRSHHYYHADIIADRPARALSAACQGRVSNWRWIDSFDTAKKDYCYYELIGLIEEQSARKPSKPRPYRLHIQACRLEKAIMAMDGVASCLALGDSQLHVHVRLYRRSPKLRAAVAELVYKSLSNYYLDIRYVRRGE